MKKIQPVQVLALVFLLPSFFQRIFIGGQISTYDDISGISLSLLGYAVHAGIILVALSDKSLIKNQVVLKYVLPLAFVSLTHLGLLYFFEGEAWVAGALGILRTLVWILACAAISYYLSEKDFIRNLVLLIDISFIVIIISIILYYVSGIPFQIVFSSGLPRAQAFFTEPSTVAAFLAGYMALSIFRRDRKRIVLSVIIVLMVNSVLAFIGFLVGGILGTLSRKLNNKKLYREVLRINYLMLMLILFVIAAYSSSISSFAREVWLSLEGGAFANTRLYSVFIERILSAAMNFDYGVELIKNNQNLEGGGVFRYTSMLLLLEQMSNSWRGFVGYGLGAHAQVMLSQGRLVLDFGLLPLIISSFGFIFGFVVLYWLAKQLTRRHSRLSVFAVPFSLMAMLNSGGGIHTYAIVLVSAFILLPKEGKSELGVVVSKSSSPVKSVSIGRYG